MLVATCAVLSACGSDDRVAGGEYDDPSAGIRCEGRQVASRSPETPAGVSTTGLGAMPAYYELRAPQARPRGVVIVLHGGGWIDVGRGQVEELRREANLWVQRGWATANLDYRACGQSLDDVVAMHDAIRAKVGPDTPIVVVGESAGAQLALVLAADRPASVGAVIAKAPPTDPVTLAAQRARDATTGANDSPLPRRLAEGWRGAFGERLAAATPTLRAKDVVARVLLARSQEDPIIPLGQLTDMAAALTRAHPQAWVKALDLPAGDVPFPHATVSKEGQASYEAAVAEAVQPWEARSPEELRVPPVVDGWWSFPAG